MAISDFKEMVEKDELIVDQKLNRENCHSKLYADNRFWKV